MQSYCGFKRDGLKVAVRGELMEGEDPALPLPLRCCANCWGGGTPEGQNPMSVLVNDDCMLPTACG